jgi:hypothetical protein
MGRFLGKHIDWLEMRPETLRRRTLYVSCAPVPKGVRCGVTRNRINRRQSPLRRLGREQPRFTRRHLGPFSESHILPPTGPRQGGWDEPYRDLSFGLSFRSGAEIALYLEKLATAAASVSQTSNTVSRLVIRMMNVRIQPELFAQIAGRKKCQGTPPYLKRRNEHRLGAGRGDPRELADGIHHR